LVKTVLTEEDKRNLKIIACEIMEIRKVVDELTETLVNLSDKELLKVFNATSQAYVKDSKVEKYSETLEKQLDVAEKEFRQ
jgi:glutathionyl-hydroquinone reductase